jgi:hypothetical protein
VARWSGDSSSRWKSNVLLACLVLATVVIVIVRSGGSPPRPAARTPAPPPPVSVMTVGHRLLGITAGWDLFARGPNYLLRIEPANGRIIETYVPPLESASPQVAFVVGAHEAVIRSFDNVPGYAVPDGGQAQQLAGVLAHGGPMVPGPPGSQAVWISTGSGASTELSLVGLTGHRPGPSIRFQPGGPELLPATAASDGRGDVLVVDNKFAVYDVGPGWERRVPGTVVAVGAATWLVEVCTQHRHCRDEVVDAITGSRRVLPSLVAEGGPDGSTWPPTGVISPDGSTAAILEIGHFGQLTVRLINLRTGVPRDLGVVLGSPVGDALVGGSADEQSMAWSPDGRWLIVAASGGNLVAVNARTGRTEGLGISLPAVYQVAIRP